MKSVLSIFRPLNLIIILLTSGVFYCKVGNGVYSAEQGATFTYLKWFVYTLNTVLIASAGYIINDWFDRKTDVINKSHKEFSWSSKQVFMSYGLLNGIAIIVGLFFFSWPFVGLVFGAPILLLLLYSWKYQRTILLGNIMVALLSAAVPFWVFVLSNQDAEISQLSEVNRVALAIILLAFTGTMSREIVKDMEDIEGDQKASYTTLVVKKGIRVSKNAALFFIFLTKTILLIITYHFLIEHSMALIFSGCIFILLLYVAYMLIKNESKKTYTKSSFIIKLTMLLSLLLLLSY